MVQRPPKKPKVNIRTLATEWDDIGAVRDYLGNNPNEALFHDNVKVGVKGACIDHIFAMLKVILLMCCSVPTQPQPSVRSLREQLALVYKKAKREPKDADVIGDSWFIRKFISLIKLKAKKGLVSTVPHLNTCMG